MKVFRFLLVGYITKSFLYAAKNKVPLHSANFPDLLICAGGKTICRFSALYAHRKVYKFIGSGLKCIYKI